MKRQALQMVPDEIPWALLALAPNAQPLLGSFPTPKHLVAAI